MLDPARRAAFDLLKAVAVDDAYANLELPKILAAAGIDGRDAAFATELGMGALRWRGLLDAVIEIAGGRPMAKLDPPLRDVLRLGSHQLLLMRVPAHAAVDTSVRLAGEVGAKSAGGLVNAVLRKVANHDLAAWQQQVSERESDPTAALAAAWSHPRWQVAALRDALGDHRAELVQLLEMDNQPPQVTGVSRTGVAGLTGLLAEGGEAGRWSPLAFRVHGDPAAVAAIKSGAAGVQDEGSQLVVLALLAAPLVGESDRNWLDLCSGPGGKSALLAAHAVPDETDLLSIELQPHRAALVTSALANLPGRVEVADATDPKFATGTFDRVLVDAPCTGLGVLRRRAESRWRRQPSDVAELSGLQRRLLANALGAVRPGGVVGFATCSPHLAETEFVVEDVLAKHPDFELLDARKAALAIPGLLNAEDFDRLTPAGPYLRLWPHLHGTDGMFLALLRRRVPAAGR